MTMRELAQLANVSISAISKAFSDADDISKETKDHIFKIAKENGCYSKFYKGKFPKPIIAVIVPEINSVHYSTYIEILEDIIESSGGIMLLSAFQFDCKKQLELIDYYSEYLQVNGIIVFSMPETAKKDYQAPIVSLFNSKCNTVDSINVDTNTAFKKSIDLLKELGHKNIAFAGEPLTTSRVTKFLEYYKPEGNPEDYIFTSNGRFEESGTECAEQILKSPIPFTAVVCAYDDIAVGVIKHLTEKGYNVPQDFSVIGNNNISVSQYLGISLTTIDPLYEKICNAVWQLLKEKMKSKYYKPKKPIEFTAELIVRDSVARAK